jgi:hypothetical protein
MWGYDDLMINDSTDCLSYIKPCHDAGLLGNDAPVHGDVLRDDGGAGDVTTADVLGQRPLNCSLNVGVKCAHTMPFQSGLPPVAHSLVGLLSNVH